MADTPYRAPALDKGLDILEYLAEVHEAHSMSDIARALGRSRNEIYRMTLALERRGYVERAEGTERFCLSHGLFELAMKSAPAANLHEAALPVMNRLADELLQSTHLAVEGEHCLGSQWVLCNQRSNLRGCGCVIRLSIL